jgi:hypothetical protein
MPLFGDDAEMLARALQDADGDDPAPEPAPPADPTLPPLGPSLVGFGGYSCVSCHIWQGKSFAEPDPGAIAPELTTVTRRIRRSGSTAGSRIPRASSPARRCPRSSSTACPRRSASSSTGDAAKQKDAVWAYFSLGKDAPAPKPLPLLPLDVPRTAARRADPARAARQEDRRGDLRPLRVERSPRLTTFARCSVRGVYVGARVVRR